MLIKTHKKRENGDLSILNRITTKIYYRKNKGEILCLELNKLLIFDNIE